MRGLIIRCNKYSFKDIAKSTRPLGIEKIEINFAGTTLEEIILVLVCIEKNDKEEYIELAAQRIKQLNNKYYNLKKIVIAPFAHLSRTIEEPEKASNLCKLLSSKLKELGFEVYDVTFGTHKSSIIDFPGEPYTISYFEFP